MNKYRKCETLSDGAVQLTLDADINAQYIELYIEKTITLPTTTTESTSGWSVKASWHSNTDYIADTTTTASLKFTPGAALSESFSGQAFSQSIKNAGEMADYEFKFKSSIGYTVGQTFTVDFPEDFDPFVGNAAKWFANENNYYLECSSSAMTYVWCTVDKRRVTVSGSAAVDKLIEIDFTIKTVCNPPKVSGTTTKLILAQLDSAGVYQAIDEDFADGGVTTTAVPGAGVTLKSVKSSDHKLFTTNSDYTFEFLLDNNTVENESVSVDFPPQYDLWLNDGDKDYGCSTTQTTLGGTGTTTTWNDDTQCEADGNNVALKNKAATRVADDVFTLAVSSVGNPEWGLKRDPVTDWDFDMSATDFTVYDRWTNKFVVSVTNATDKSKVQKTYCNLNSGYVGFDNAYGSDDQIIIADWNPDKQTGGVKVWAGSFSDNYPIRPGGLMKAKSVILTPTENSRTRKNPDGKLAFTSDQKFTLFQEVTEIHFKVGADINLAKGVYYIDWKINEDGQTSTGLTDHYQRPVKTRVEVVEKTTDKYTFVADSFSTPAYVGTSTPSMSVHVSNAPYADVTVKLELKDKDQTDIKFTPDSLVFAPGVTELFYRVEIASTYDTSKANSAKIVFTIAGTDAEVFAAPGELSFNINDAQEGVTAGSITTFNAPTSPTTDINVAFTPAVTQIGTLWYVIGAKGKGAGDAAGSNNDCPTLEQIRTVAAAPYVSESEWTAEQKTNYNQISEAYGKTETEPLADETWATFQQRLYTEHLQMMVAGSMSISNTQSVDSIHATWLWAQTQYQICGYLENVYGDVSTPVKVEYVTTPTMNVPYSWKIASKGDTKVAIDDSVILDNVAYVQGVNPKRLTVEKADTTEPARRLNDEKNVRTWTGTTLQSRKEMTPTPKDIATLSAPKATELEGKINAHNSQYSVSSGYAEEAYTPKQATVSWTVEPTLKGTTVDSATISCTSDNQYGEMVCIAVDDFPGGNDFKPSNTQMLLGLGADNQVPAARKKIAAHDGTAYVTELTLDGLTRGTKYHAFCTATNGEPVWPVFVSWSSQEAFKAIEITTAGEADTDDDDDDSALLTSTNVVALCTMLAALIFN